MSTPTGPMDPERLAELRREVEWRHNSIRGGLVSELLADRDHQAAGAVRLRRELDASEAELFATMAQRESARNELDARTVERDEARVNVCERAAVGRPGHEGEHDYDEPSDAARDFGWSYLYPEGPSDE